MARKRTARRQTPKARTQGTSTPQRATTKKPRKVEEKATAAKATTARRKKTSRSKKATKKSGAAGTKESGQPLVRLTTVRADDPAVAQVMLASGAGPLEPPNGDWPFAVGRAFEPEPDDRPVGGLTDQQLGSTVRLITARGYGAFLFRSGGQIYLRIVRQA